MNDKNETPEVKVESFSKAKSKQFKEFKQSNIYVLN